MINFETREKLGNLDLFKNNCFFRGRCLPNPTVEELIDAIDKKVDGKQNDFFDFKITYKSLTGKRYLCSISKTLNGRYFMGDDYKQVLCEALIWLNEEEEQC